MELPCRSCHGPSQCQKRPGPPQERPKERPGASQERPESGLALPPENLMWYIVLQNYSID